ncbi:heavy metal translocating P-type ATPase [Muriicola soli]|uniref:HAD family hydrolase n=1 Tax=Muriicola soli TaxID=2507538 RepID=A0A411E6T6_9FLAO|nr:heavy metal translocating P-type ATPase metal-binding domain-containing protein [Muriicola soli]QBA63233.1 HAD family hydrolase [Muriicola soli]
MDNKSCFHCGDPCDEATVLYQDKTFCCNGCKTVYEIFDSNDLKYYYDLQSAAGSTPKLSPGKYDYLENSEIAEQLLEFNDGKHQIISLFIPTIHCSSCIWVLENLGKLAPGIVQSQVDFPKKTLRISFRDKTISLKEIVELLAKIGYEPNISLADSEVKKNKDGKKIIYQLGVAGFGFGNIMFLSFPEYFEVGEYWLEQYKMLFRWLMFAFSLPVVFYAGRDYLLSAYKGIKSNFLNIDVPIALGILVLFIRSTLEIIFDWGSGFFDSLSGLIFFLLLGKYFQQRTYSFLSFERDYKSYFPVAITRIFNNGREESVRVNDLKKGDRLLIRHGELIPVDGILETGPAEIDYSFVTGEARPVHVDAGEKVFAGGKQLGGPIEMTAQKKVSQSYLTQLWSHNVFGESSDSKFKSLTDSIGKRFTIAVLSIAIVSALYWVFTEPGKVWNVFTAVLIIACPCAIALAAPFTLGNMLRIFGKKKFYLKDVSVIEKLAKIDTAIFDKTGTLTTRKHDEIFYEGSKLTKEEKSLMKSTLRASNHPLSRSLYSLLKEHNILSLDQYEEYIGLGLFGSKGDNTIKIGSSTFVDNCNQTSPSKAEVHISTNSNYRGRFVLQSQYRNGITDLMSDLRKQIDLAVLSGDHDGERNRLQTLLPGLTPMYFDQNPKDKLYFVKELQDSGKRVMMVGDGLNDAGALAQSDVGIALAEDINVFSPACDGILDATAFTNLSSYINASKKAMGIIRLSFVLSLAYNLIGLYFAVTGQLQPVIAAILMPLSSISIVAFTTIATNWLGRRIK